MPQHLIKSETHRPLMQYYLKAWKRYILYQTEPHVLQLQERQLFHPSPSLPPVFIPEFCTDHLKTLRDRPFYERGGAVSH